MNIAVNELLRDNETQETLRVLWIDEGNVIAYLINVYDEKALPFKCLVREIIDDIIQDQLIKIKDDPFVITLNLELSEKGIEMRDKAWMIIQDMVKDEPAIYEKQKRIKHMNKAMALHQVTYPALRKYLRKYWQRGKTPNALLPDYHKSGGKGKEKNISSKKRGRPRKDSSTGMNVDEKTKKIFHLALEKYYLTAKKNRLTDAYRMMIREFYAQDYYYENGIARTVIEDENSLPTLGQFRYWYSKEYSIQESLLARQGRKRYEKDHRAVLGSSTTEAIGPGSRFQIDATVADVYVISRYNEEWIIGRPVLYLVIDVFSRMIVGLYIGLEGPSWVGAMMALTNTVTDKVQFCSQYGIHVSKEQWPCEHLPEVLLADRGELEGCDIERLISAFNLHVENAAPYRADWKGIVEKKFDTMQTKVKPFLPGYVEKDFIERGAQDYRIGAKLTIEHLYQIMIHQIIKYNTTYYLSYYTRDEEMIQDDVVPNPIRLWNWGIQNRAGKLRYVPEKLVRLHLLPRGKATVTHKGIKFNSMMYGAEIALKEGWFPKARQKGSWKLQVSYDPRNMSYLYLMNEETTDFEVCYLLEHQSRYLDKTLDEVIYLLEYEKLMKKGTEHQELQADVELIDDIEQVVTHAKKQAKKKVNKAMSQAAKTKAIRANRQAEREERQQEEAFVMTEKQEEKAEVISLHSEEKDFSRPSIKDILRKRKELK